jgi:hypothetical protein
MTPLSVSNNWWKLLTGGPRNHSKSSLSFEKHGFFPLLSSSLAHTYATHIRNTHSQMFMMFIMFMCVSSLHVREWILEEERKDSDALFADFPPERSLSRKKNDNGTRKKERNHGVRQLVLACEHHREFSVLRFAIHRVYEERIQISNN